MPGEDDAFYKYWVSGTVTKGGNPLQGATVTCGSKTATTAANGTYTVKGIPPGNRTVTPSKQGETFTPASRNVNLSGTVVNGQDFAANVKISGTVTKGGNGVAGVTIAAGGKTATTAADGTYTVTGIAPNQNVTVTPTKAGVTFTPASRSIAVQTIDVNGQDFTAN